VLGLIYKDLVHSKILPITFCANLLIGSAIIIAGGDAFLSVIYIFMMFIFGSIIPDMAFTTDEMFKWDVYARTLPTVRKTPTARYLLLLAVYGSCLLFSSVSALIGKNVDVYFVISVCAFLTAFDSVSYIFYYRFGARKGGSIKLIVMSLFPAAFVLYLLFGDLSVFGSEGFLDFFDWVSGLGFTGITKRIWLPLLIIAAVCFVGGCVISGKVYGTGAESAEK